MLNAVMLSAVVILNGYAEYRGAKYLKTEEREGK
jgi:hypothetical protein